MDERETPTSFDRDQVGVKDWRQREGVKLNW
jgi:hypothetical protein